VGLLLVVPSYAQPPGGGDTEGEGTLPDIVVTPDEEPPLPPITVTPDEGVSGADTLFDRSDFFPALSDLQLGQANGFGTNTGILRSATSVFDAPQAVSVITRQSLEEKQTTQMFEALQNEVGVLMQRTAAGQTSPFIRGLTGQQILLLIDGIRMNNSVYRFGPNQYFNTIDPGMVDHLEVVRGSSSVLWGSDAIGGAINVVTRGPAVPFCDCWDSYTGSEFREFFNTSDVSSYSRLNVEGWVGSSGIFSGGSYQNVRNLDTGFEFGRQPGTNYSGYAGDIKWNYLIDDSQLLTVSLQHYELEDVPRSDRYPGYPGDLNNSNSAGGARFFDPQQRDLAYVRYQAIEPIRGIDALTATASYHRQREIQTRGIPTARFQETDVDTFGLNLVMTKDMCRWGRFSVGADWYHDDVDSPFGGTASGPIVPDDAWYERIGAYATWDAALTCKLDIAAGVRYEHINLAGTPVIDIGGVPTPVFIEPQYQDWVGQVGLVYRLSPCVHVVGNVSEGFRAPNLDELMANNPNVLQEGMDLPSLDLSPEHSLSYEVGIKTDFDRIRSQMYVFWMDLDDNIVPVTAGSNEFRRDNQDSYIQGVEFDGEWLWENNWSVYGNFTYTYGLNLITRAPLSRIPPTQGTVGLRWRSDDLRTFLTAYVWMVRRQDRLDPVRDLSDERIPPGGTPGFGTLNVRLGRTFGECHQHRLSVILENITDKDYLVHGSGVFGTGFTGRLGYNWTY
jgi:outer membrane receptor protein involved in Fe transport